MVKYTGPRVRIIRRLGPLPGLTCKNINPAYKEKTPGEKGQNIKNIDDIEYFFLKEDYKNCLLEKQKLRYNYGITEKQLYYYYQIAKKSNKLTGNVLLELLESRLDSIIYRFGFVRTMPSARQLINHNYVLVNNKVISIPSFICKKGDTISMSQKSINLVHKFLHAQQLRQEIMERKTKLSSSTIINEVVNYLLTPSNIEIEENLLSGKILNSPKRKDFPVLVDEFKVIQYYSR